MFTVTVTDANGCTGSISQNVSVNNNPTPAISGNLTACDGTSSSLNAGNGYASYNWSTGGCTSSITVSTSGTYTVTVTDLNGCNRDYEC
ncbi:MAG: hypothetical protein IPM91_07370 [Bacteroidetes bacterium]|nr:hypothetical protein [Bacteroidota bacterium]